MSDRTRRGAAKPRKTVTPATAQTPVVSGSNAQAQELTFGQRLTDRVSGMVEKNASAEVLGGHASSFLTERLGAFGNENLANADPANASQYLDALRMQRMFRVDSDTSLQLGEAVADHPLVHGLSDLATNNPWPAALLGAGAFIASDQELDFDKRFRLGDSGFSLDAGADFGSTLDVGLDAVRGGASYKGEKSSASLHGEYRLDGDNVWSLAGTYNRELANESNLAFNLAHEQNGESSVTSGGVNWKNETTSAFLNGSYSREPEGNSWDVSAGLSRDLGNGSNLSFSAGHHHTPLEDVTSAGMNWSNKDTAAYLRGTYTQGQEGNVGRIAAGVQSRGDGPLQWNVNGWADTNSEYNLGAGLSYVPDRDDNFAAYVRANARRNAQGETDAGIFAGVGWEF